MNQGTALFREISNGAVIKNLTVTGSVEGFTHAAGLVGFSRNGDENNPNTIENCTVDVDVSVPATSGNTHMGGVVGHGVTSYLKIKDTVFSGSMNNKNFYAGGFQGWSDGNHLTIENCLFKGKYLGSASFHPIAIHNTGSTTDFSGSYVYYTIAPTSIAEGFVITPDTQVYVNEPFEKTCDTVTAADGNTYYIPTGDTEPFIRNAADWEAFAAKVASGNTYEGKTVTLCNDITVTQMIGTTNHRFKGTLNGAGHTLTFNYGTSETPASAEDAAPFAFTENAAIRFLKVNGTIYTNRKFAAGIAAHTYGDSTIENCISSINVVSNVDGDGTHAGFVAVHQEGTLHINQCH